MKKLLKLSIYILICISLISCNTQNNVFNKSQELIRYTTGDTLKAIKPIKNRKTINEIKNIVKTIKWSNEVIHREDKYYSFWIEKEGHKERMGMYDIWSNDEETIIFDEKRGKYGHVNLDNKDKLNEIFNWN